MELPIEDLALINALQVAPRATWLELSQVLDRHPVTLSSRWRRLREQRLVWTTGHLSGRYRQQCAALVEIEADPETLDATGKELCRLSEVLSVHVAPRNVDFVLTCVASSWEALTREVLPQVTSIPGIRRAHTLLTPELFTTGEMWRLDVLSSRQIKALRELAPTHAEPSTRVSESVLAMLPVLRADGRASIRELARATGQHPATASRTLKAALASGMISIRCEIAMFVSGYPLAVFWSARVPPGSERLAVAHLSQQRALRVCSSITGRANLVFAMQLRSPAEIGEIERDLARAVPGLRIIECVAGVRYLKRMGWLLDDNERPLAAV